MHLLLFMSKQTISDCCTLYCLQICTHLAAVHDQWPEGGQDPDSSGKRPHYSFSRVAVPLSKVCEEA